MKPGTPQQCAWRVQVAIDNEVVVAISNKNYAGVGNMLDTWMEHVKRAGVKNAMVVALDEPTRQHADSQGVASQIFKLEVRPCSRSSCCALLRLPLLCSVRPEDCTATRR